MGYACSPSIAMLSYCSHQPPAPHSTTMDTRVLEGPYSAHHGLHSIGLSAFPAYGFAGLAGLPGTPPFNYQVDYGGGMGGSSHIINSGPGHVPFSIDGILTSSQSPITTTASITTTSASHKSPGSGKLTFIHSVADPYTGVPYWPSFWMILALPDVPSLHYSTYTPLHTCPNHQTSQTFNYFVQQTRVPLLYPLIVNFNLVYFYIYK